MLSPVDIQNKEFRKAKLGGYNVVEVNEFLDEVLEGYQRITKENHELKDKINMLNENIQYYRTMEATIQNALVLAEKTAQDTKSLAYERADQIKKDAEQKAESTLDEAKKDIYMLSNKIEELKKQYLSIKVQIKQMLQAQLEMLEQQNISMLTDEISSPIKFDMTNAVEEVAITEEDDEFFTKEFTLPNDEEA